MHIISRKKLLEVAKRHGGPLGSQLDAWYRTTKSANWRNLDEVRRTYSHADGVRVGKKTYTVFNIGGNNFRLVTEIFYETQTVLIRHVITHAEYDTGHWKK